MYSYYYCFCVRVHACECVCVCVDDRQTDIDMYDYIMYSTVLGILRSIFLQKKNYTTNTKLSNTVWILVFIGQSRKTRRIFTAIDCFRYYENGNLNSLMYYTVNVFQNIIMSSHSLSYLILYYSLATELFQSENILVYIIYCKIISTNFVCIQISCNILSYRIHICFYILFIRLFKLSVINKLYSSEDSLFIFAVYFNNKYTSKLINIAKKIYISQLPKINFFN